MKSSWILRAANRVSRKGNFIRFWQTIENSRPPQGIHLPIITRWALNGQRALDGIFDLCLADPGCHTAFPDPREEFTSLMARLAKEPATITFSNKALGSASLTPDYLAPVIRMMIRFGKEDASLPLYIHRAYAQNDFRDFQRFIEANRNYEWWGDIWMDHVIRCSEKWAAFDPGDVARVSEGSFLKGFDVMLSTNQALACQYVPRGVTLEGTSLQPGSRVPVLIVNGSLDPINPPENMAGAKALFPNSAALVLPYQGHSINNFTAISCLWDIENEFIQSGSADGLHTGCLNEIQPPYFITQ